MGTKISGIYHGEDRKEWKARCCKKYRNRVDASAEYLAYADIDDVMDPCMYEKLLLAAKQQECDLVVCRSKKVNPHDLLNQDSKRIKKMTGSLK